MEDPECQVLGLGFCGPDDGENKMPGWFKGSCGYHGDDGYLYIEQDFSTEPFSQDFGTQGKFGAGDTVGVYFNLKTGEAFCTLNGVKLDMGSKWRKYTPRQGTSLTTEQDVRSFPKN